MDEENALVSGTISKIVAYLGVQPAKKYTGNYGNFLVWLESKLRTTEEKRLINRETSLLLEKLGSDHPLLKPTFPSVQTKGKSDQESMDEPDDSDSMDVDEQEEVDKKNDKEPTPPAKTFTSKSSFKGQKMTLVQKSQESGVFYFTSTASNSDIKNDADLKLVPGIHRVNLIPTQSLAEPHLLGASATLAHQQNIKPSKDKYAIKTGPTANQALFCEFGIFSSFAPVVDTYDSNLSQFDSLLLYKPNLPSSPSSTNQPTPINEILNKSMNIDVDLDDVELDGIDVDNILQHGAAAEDFSAMSVNVLLEINARVLWLLDREQNKRILAGNKEATIVEIDLAKKSQKILAQLATRVPPSTLFTIEALEKQMHVLDKRESSYRGTLKRNHNIIFACNSPGTPATPNAQAQLAQQRLKNGKV